MNHQQKEIYKAAQCLLVKEDYSEALERYMILISINPTWKNVIMEEFNVTLGELGNELGKAGNLGKLSHVFKTAEGVFSENHHIPFLFGKALFRLGLVDSAVVCLRRALSLSPDSTPIRLSLQNVLCTLVDRWHFIMLNDLTRNQTFREAILKKVREGHCSVLDIGAGTGLLSLFAAEGGATRVFACEMCPTMTEVLQQVLNTNSEGGKKITVISKSSTELTIPSDIPERVSFMVTETFDAGLLGEHILTTLNYAWTHLLTPHAAVIPAAATVMATVVECPYVFRRCQVNESITEEFNIRDLRIVASRSSGCYSSERLQTVPTGWRALTIPTVVATFDFCSPQAISDSLAGWEKDVIVRACSEGRAHAIVSWFELQLDETCKLSSSPFVDSCWEQAVYPLYGQVFIKDGTDVKLKVKCLESLSLLLDQTNNKKHPNATYSKKNVIKDPTEEKLLRIVSCKEGQVSAQECCSSESIKYLKGDKTCATPNCLDQSIEGSSNCPSKPIAELTMPSDAIVVVNDQLVGDFLWRCIEEAREKRVARLARVVDLSIFPLCGLRLVKQLRKAELVCCVAPEVRTVIIKLASRTGVDPRRITFLETDWNELPTADISLLRPLEVSGVLNDRLLSDALSASGFVAPCEVDVWGILVDSEQLERMCRFVSDDNTLGYKISIAINIFQTIHHQDIHLATLPHRLLSLPCKLLAVNLLNPLSLVSHHQTHQIPVVSQGRLSGLVYWCVFKTARAEINTLQTLHRQAAWLVEPPFTVQLNSSVTVKVTCEKGAVEFKIDAVEKV